MASHISEHTTSGNQTPTMAGELACHVASRYLFPLIFATQTLAHSALTTQALVLFFDYTKLIPNLQLLQ